MKPPRRLEPTGGTDELVEEFDMGQINTRGGGLVGLSDLRTRNEYIRALQGIGPRLIYAVRTGDDLVKIGSSARFIDRIREIKGGVSEILALKPGDWADELAIHHRLAGHATEGREYYFPSKGVLREVNAMRAPLGLDPIVFERRWAS